MTREERRAYVRRIVDAAPSLAPEDADLLRALVPMGGRRAAVPAPDARSRRPAARTAAA